MQVQKLVLGPKFGAHIAEHSNDQGLKTVFMSSRTSCSRQKTSCTVLVDKGEHFNFCCTYYLWISILLLGSFIAVTSYSCDKLQHLHFNVANCRLPTYLPVAALAIGLQALKPPGFVSVW